MCHARGSVCVNLPATTFQEGNETLEAVLQARPVRQAMIVDNHATTMRLFAAWRDSSCTLKARRSAPREALSGSVRGSERRRATDAAPLLCLLYVNRSSSEFLLEELLCPQQPHTTLGVRLWKVFIDPQCAVAREPRARASDGGQQRRGASSCATVELLQVYSSVGCAGVWSP
eukprot:6103328-Prymnesium_polylepis.1